MLAYLAAERAVPASVPAPGGNGGKRIPAPQRLTPAPAAEADVAMLAWSGSLLEQAAHGLFTTRPWTWRRLTLADLQAAAHRRALRQAPSGWAVADGAEGILHVSWLCTRPEEARLMLRALVDLAGAAEAERLDMEVPNVDWLRAALEQAGWELHPVPGLRPGHLTAARPTEIPPMRVGAIGMRRRGPAGDRVARNDP